MVWYLSKLLFLVIFSFYVIFIYYFWFDFHKESFVWYTPYVISIAIFYFLYKWYNYILNKDKITFTPIKIFSYFLLQLLVLSIMTFSISGASWWNWVGLFFNIIIYLILPIIFSYTFLSTWRYLLSKIEWFKLESSIFQFLSSLWVWFFVFITLLSIFWFFGFYNIWIVFWITILLNWVSYKELSYFLKNTLKYEFTLDDHDFWNNSKNIIKKININLLSTEILFIIISFLLSVNLINAFRPMPIWWDDLWVYMNYPNLMAAKESILYMGWLYIWQVFTWIWYMVWPGTQSFFLNNLWWIFSVIVIVLSIIDLFKSDKKTFLNIPLLLAWVYLAMPMTIFEQAKDQKLDPGLFFISIIVLYMVYYIFSKYMWYETTKQLWDTTLTIDSNSCWEEIKVVYDKKTKNWFTSYFSSYKLLWEDIFEKKSYLIYLFVIWILAWLAFWIKVTSLLLISWIIWLIFYSKLWIAWFFSYISLYIAIFTKAWLWSMMNVIYPKDDIGLINNIFYIWIIISIILFWYAINKYSFKAFKKTTIILWLFLVWIWVWVSPWFAKNIYEAKSVSINSMLSWKSDSFLIDYNKIYSRQELETINKNFQNTWLSTSWTIANEDWGRYFWYEKWVNNYLKLPYNLTMQVNQKGEFTDITYIFLALIPLVLFLSYKWIFSLIWTFIYLSFISLFYFNSWVNTYLTNLFEKFELPVWYIVVFLFFLIPFLWIIYNLKKDKFSQLFKLNLVFWFFYVFLWTISAFWVVWYGIVMYYSILYAFWIGIYYLSSYDETLEFKDKIFKFFGSIVVFIIFSTYFFASSFPHWFTNLKQSSYLNFKAWQESSYVAIFESHPDYFDALVELNLNKEAPNKITQKVLKNIKNTNLKNILENNKITSLIDLNKALREISRLDNNQNQINWMNLIKKEVKDIRNYIYKLVLYPTKDYQNKDWIYRIWTFLKYFISSNNNRLFEDSLVFEFIKYFYDEKHVNVWVERLKQMWVNYFLVDLNAATIDKDPSHNLTTRYEKLLKTFTSERLELIQTDSICLKLALEDYNASPKTEQDLKEYILTAWVNYESYTSSWEVINRWTKQIQCYQKILNYMQKEWKINEKNYSYLVPLINYLNQNKISKEEDLVNFFRNYVWAWWMVLFRIK